MDALYKLFGSKNKVSVSHICFDSGLPSTYESVDGPLLILLLVLYACRHRRLGMRPVLLAIVSRYRRPRAFPGVNAIIITHAVLREREWLG